MSTQTETPQIELVYPDTPSRNASPSIMIAWGEERGINQDTIDIYHNINKYFTAEAMAAHFKCLQDHKKNRWLFPTILRLHSYKAGNISRSQKCERLWYKVAPKKKSRMPRSRYTHRDPSAWFLLKDI